MATVNRSQDVVWQATQQDAKRRPSPQRNISDNERRYSALGGAALLLAGLSRGRLSGLLMSLAGGALVYRGWTGHCHCYEALGIHNRERNSATAVSAQQGIKIERAITINRSPDELFQFWRDLEKLPKVMRHIQHIQTISADRSHWVARTPWGQTLQWDAETLNEREPELIAWRSLPGGDVETAGSVRFQSQGHDRGTVVSISLKYNPPGGKAAASLADFFGAGLESELDEDLRRFKSAMEAGEVPTTSGQPSGRMS